MNNLLNHFPVLIPVAIGLAYLTYVYVCPFLYLNWALMSREMKTYNLRLADGQSQVVGYDYFMDHCAWQWAHRISRRDGLLFAEQWTADYGHAAELAMGLYINGRKLRKGELRQIPEGAVVYQLSWYTKKILHFSLSDASERSPATQSIVWRQSK